MWRPTAWFFSLVSPDGDQNYPGEMYVEAGFYFRR